MNAAPPPYARAVALHSVGWLVAANLVGAWLALSLLWPALGDALAPLTFGRWTPLHMNWQLYGWCALPVVGALLAWCVPAAHPRAWRHAVVSLVAWSAALALGGAAWLGGSVSGKLFLDWHSWTRPLLPAAMYVLWMVLAFHTRREWAQLGAAARVLRVVVLGGLFAVPPIIYIATGRTVYHPINPDSGGATGAAVLGSTLGIVTILMLLPALLGVPRQRSTVRFEAALALAWLVFAATDRGNTSHHSTAQIVALATLMLWVPLLPLYWFRHAWPAPARPWLRAASTWWVLLVFNGWISFLPAVSEALKFTHALVGHAHLAMAGLLTSVNGAILVTLTRRPASPGVFWLWQAGCLVYIVSMLALGIGEIEHVAELFRSEPWTQALLGLRLAGGLAMTTASVRWLTGLLRE